MAAVGWSRPVPYKTPNPGSPHRLDPPKLTATNLDRRRHFLGTLARVGKPTKTGHSQTRVYMQAWLLQLNINTPVRAR